MEVADLSVDYGVLAVDNDLAGGRDHERRHQRRGVLAVRHGLCGAIGGSAIGGGGVHGFQRVGRVRVDCGAGGGVAVVVGVRGGVVVGMGGQEAFKRAAHGRDARVCLLRGARAKSVWDR